MPIKPENRHRYPSNWKDISYDIRVNRAQNKCEVCGRENYSIYDKQTGKYPEHWKWEQFHRYLNDVHSGYTYSALLKVFGFVKVVLTVAHLDHQPENCDYSNLKAMCQRCHNQYDVEHRKETRKNEKLKGQMKLF